MTRDYQDLAIVLSFEFQKYLDQHPETASRLPKDPLLLFQVDGNAAFNRWSRRITKRGAERGETLVEVHVHRMGPPVSRIQEVDVRIASRSRARRVRRIAAR